MVIPIKIVSFVIELNYSNTMYGKMKDFLSQTLAEIKEAGLYKEERLIESAQQAAITVKGKEVFKYAFSDDELEEVKKEIGKGFLIQRYKGLGEMNPEQLWDTTLNPETRTLYKVTIEDAAKAEKMVSLLMGDVVEPRKNYMYKYAEF